MVSFYGTCSAKNLDFVYLKIYLNKNKPIFKILVLFAEFFFEKKQIDKVRKTTNH